MSDRVGISSKERTEERVRARYNETIRKNMVGERNGVNLREKSRECWKTVGEVRVKKTRLRGERCGCQSLHFSPLSNFGSCCLQGSDIKWCESGGKQGIESSRDIEEKWEIAA